MAGRLSKLGTCLSQCINALVLDGDPDESICGRAHREGWELEATLDWIFAWYENRHCYRSYASDVKRAAWLLNQKRRIES